MERLPTTERGYPPFDEEEPAIAQSITHFPHKCSLLLVTGWRRRDKNFADLPLQRWAKKVKKGEPTCNSNAADRRFVAKAWGSSEGERMPKKDGPKAETRRIFTDTEIEKMLSIPKRIIGRLNFDKMKREPGDPAKRMTVRAQDDEGREYRLSLELNAQDPRLFSFLLEVSQSSQVMTPIARINSQHHEHSKGGGKRHLHYYTEAQAMLGRNPICTVKPLDVPARFDDAAHFALEFFRFTQAGIPGQDSLPFSGR